jgi:hypothetical protein
LLGGLVRRTTTRPADADGRPLALRVDEEELLLLLTTAPTADAEVRYGGPDASR